MATIGPSFEKNISRLLTELPIRARSVVKRRYGIGSQEPLTLEAIGEKEGITRERVRQIEHDALEKLKKSQAFFSLSRERSFISDTLKNYGGMKSEAALLNAKELKTVGDKHGLILFFDICGNIIRRSENGSFFVRWHTTDVDPGKIENAVLSYAKELCDSYSTMKEKDALTQLNAHCNRYGLIDATPVMLTSFIECSKEIQKNRWGEYGHIRSPFVRPRGMRDGAYVALSRAKEPLHFRDIAKRIEEFSIRNVHIQTVHNELIKDPRFVLVGRGLYALKEWGYEPGFVKDVLVKLLKDNGPLHKDVIVKKILENRQVKPGTILINLQNKKLFCQLDDGIYTLVS